MGDLVISKADTLIASLDDWFEHAPPKRGARHWRDGRSAKELARACCGEAGTQLPLELEHLLKPLIGVLEHAQGWPEARLAMDSLQGEPPNLDLALHLEGSEGSISVAVEAKADESFGARVDSLLLKAARRIAADEVTKAVERVQTLALALLPRWVDGLPHLGDLRYQLLTGAAGALSLAREHGTSRAAFVVYEFIDQTRTSPTKRRRNRQDLDSFVARLTNGEVTHLRRGDLLGPLRVPGTDLIPGSVDLYLGKIRRELRAQAGA
jgi:hypothetical protein